VSNGSKNILGVKWG